MCLVRVPLPLRLNGLLRLDPRSESQLSLYQTKYGASSMQTEALENDPGLIQFVFGAVCYYFRAQVYCLCILSEGALDPAQNS